MQNSIILLISRLFLFFSLCFCSNFSYSAEKNNEIRAIRGAKQSKTGVTRLVVDVKQKPEFKFFTLENPPRVVLDVQKSKWKLTQKPNLDGLVLKTRFATKENGVLRVVFDMKETIKSSKIQIIEPKEKSPFFKIVLDISSKGKKLPEEITLAKPNIFKHLDENPNLLDEEPQILNVPQIKKKRKFIIAIDAGHGGEDPGAIGKFYGTREKIVTLQYAKYLQKILNETENYKAILTRENDKFMKLSTRVEKAKKLSADVFISIHADSSPSRMARGMSIYTLSEVASDKESARLANSENKADFIVEPQKKLKNEESEVIGVLFDLAKRNKNNQSAILASHIAKEMQESVEIFRKMHRFAGFRVLRGSTIPAILLELGYLSNKHDEKLIGTRSYREKVTQGIKRALNLYFAGKENSP